MSDCIAIDAQGNVMHLHDLTSITPAGLLSVCQEAALEFLQTYTASGVTSAEGLMNVPLYTPGLEDPTHFGCVRKAYCDEVRNLESFMAAKESADIADRKFTLEDDPEFIRQRMGIFCGDFAAFLTHCGLEVR